MYELNSVLIEGTATAKPVLTTTEAGSMVCRFQVETKQRISEDAKTSRPACFDVEAWSRLGQVCAETLDTGHRMRVVGRLARRLVTVDGLTRTEVCIVAEHVEFMRT